MLVVAAAAFEAGSTVSDVHPLQLAALNEMLQRTKDRRGIGRNAAGADRSMSVVEGPSMAFRVRNELGHSVADMTRTTHAAQGTGYASCLQYSPA